MNQKKYHLTRIVQNWLGILKFWLGKSKDLIQNFAILTGNLKFDSETVKTWLGIQNFDSGKWKLDSKFGNLYSEKVKTRIEKTNDLNLTWTKVKTWLGLWKFTQNFKIDSKIENFDSNSEILA